LHIKALLRGKVVAANFTDMLTNPKSLQMLLDYLKRTTKRQHIKYILLEPNTPAATHLNKR
jgi:hypothetical protein